MSNYTKTTDFEAKDSLPSGDSGKIIRGSEFETEFDNIATAIATKADAASPTFTGTVTIDGLTVNGNTTLGNAATDTVTVTADIASNLIPSADDTYDLGASGAEWNDLYIDGTANIDSLVADTADIDGGTIDGVTIGGSSAGAITGTTITGTGFVTSGDMTFGDNDKAIFGAGSDLSIYHDGSNSYIDDSGTGLLRLRSSQIYLEKYTGEIMAALTADAGVNLRYDNAIKLETTSTGVDVTGTVTADGLTVQTTQGNITIPTSTSSLNFDRAGSNYIRATDATGSFTFITGASDFTTQRLKLLSNGDVAFYEDTGTTEKLLWDASQERLEIDSVNANVLRLERNGGTDANVSIEFNCATNDWYVGTNPANNFAIGTSLDQTNAPFQIDSSGNVGIGTSSPNYLLDVESSGSLFRINATSGDATAQLSVADTTSLNTINFGDSGSTIAGQILYRHNGDSMAFNVGGAEAIRILNGGNVGVGTSSPQALVHLTDTSADVELRLTSAATDKNIITFGDSTDQTGGAIKYDNASNYMSFETQNNIEAMRIDSSGNLLVNKSAVSTSGDGHILYPTGEHYFLANGTGSEQQVRFYRNVDATSALVGSISTTGTATAFNTSSDQRLKDNIVDAPSASDDIDAIQVRSFDWKADGSHQKYGMVAQELQSVAPEAVTGDADSDDMMSVDYSKLVPMMLKEIQSLRARVAQLEGEN
jgi:hypothetical protein